MEVRNSSLAGWSVVGQRLEDMAHSAASWCSLPNYFAAGGLLVPAVQLDYLSKVR